MIKYRRFIAYIYEYRKGKKENNCGFLRVEIRDESITIEIHLKCPGLPENENYHIYGFVRNSGLMEGILLSDTWSGGGMLDCIIESDKLDDDSWKNEFMNFGGIVILTEQGAFFGTEWDDYPIKPENFEIRKYMELQKDDELKTQEDSKEMNNNKMAEPEKEEITSEIEYTKNEQEEVVDERKFSSLHTQEIDSSESAFCPFDDCEFTECRKVHPKDFFKNCPSGCAMRNNRFLEHGYYNFGHLIVGKRTDDQWILGVPGGYDQNERFMANMFGFPYFKESREIQLPRGRGGYWYRLINPSNFHKGNSFF